MASQPTFWAITLSTYLNMQKLWERHKMHQYFILFFTKNPRNTVEVS